MNIKTEHKDPYPAALGHLQGTVTFQAHTIKHYASQIGKGLFTDEELTKKITEAVRRLQEANEKTEQDIKKQNQ